MRITTAARGATRRRILEVGREWFAARGFDPITTRDIAGAAAIATGTLFNDFATKEAIAAALVAAAEQARNNFPISSRRSGWFGAGLLTTAVNILVSAALLGAAPAEPA